MTIPLTEMGIRLTGLDNGAYYEAQIVATNEWTSDYPCDCPSDAQNNWTTVAFSQSTYN
jgi:hypothetical protein